MKTPVTQSGLVVLSVLIAVPSTALAAQFYDPSEPRKGSALELLETPADGVAYHQMHMQARRLVDEERGAEAERLAERLVREYPRDGENWLLLARAKRLVSKPAEAAAAYERAGRILGWMDAGYHPGPGGARPIIGIEMAMSYLAAGDRRAALDALRTEVFERQNLYRALLYDWPGLADLRDDPEFREIVGRPDTSGWTRDDGWRHDIDHLVGEVERVNPVYRHRPLPAGFARRYEKLIATIPESTDEQILVGMNRMLATLRQGHTGMRVIPADGPIQDRRLPIVPYAFPEGLFIVNATADHGDLIGSRIVTIGNRSAEDALRLVNETQSTDGDMEYLLSGPAVMRSLPFLLGLGIADSAGSIALAHQPPGGEVETVRLATVAPDAALIRPTTKLSPRLSPAPGAAPPLFLQHLHRMHWEQALPEHDAHYVQMNQVMDDEEETLPAFSIRLRSLLAEGAPGNLIVDLRFNTGGTTQNYPEFLRSVVGFSQQPGNQVYIIIGRHTYSAAANLITDLERTADPLFVGEASSGCCNFFGDAATVRLPYSGVTGAVTGARWNRSKDVFDARREMSPHVPVQLTVADWLAGRDPALEAIFTMIGAQSVRRQSEWLGSGTW